MTDQEKKGGGGKAHYHEVCVWPYSTYVPVKKDFKGDAVLN
jgi:hypothetical protein